MAAARGDKFNEILANVPRRGGWQLPLILPLFGK